TDDRAQEIADMRQTSGAKEVTRENAESELFGAAPDESANKAVVAAVTDDLNQQLSTIAGSHQRGEAKPYDPSQLEQGVILNAAVLLKDDTQTAQTVTAIEAAGKQAGLPLKAITWQKAAGLIGQFATLMRVVLFTAVLIIFVVALVIINNALVMATLERVREIGTLRAVGAQRRFILAMLVLESVAVGLSFGALGTALGALLIAVLGKVGIARAMTY
ncbi:MAG TPA: FtsX-like permease family protein, partial [Polyangiaceae bacterium]